MLLMMLAVWGMRLGKALILTIPIFKGNTRNESAPDAEQLKGLSDADRNLHHHSPVLHYSVLPMER